MDFNIPRYRLPYNPFHLTSQAIDRMILGILSLSATGWTTTTFSTKPERYQRRPLRRVRMLKHPFWNSPLTKSVF